MQPPQACLVGDFPGVACAWHYVNMSELTITTQLSAIEGFGGIDADADDLLKACFEDHNAYVSARDLAKFLVLGRKGSGKTAIYKRLITEHGGNTFSLGHSFDDYPWHHHDLQAEVGVPEERRYIHSWKYMILLGVAKVLLNNDQSQPWSDDSADAMSVLEDFVVDSYGSRDPDMRQLFSPEKQLRFKGSMDLKVLQIGVESMLVRDLPIHIQSVNKAMQEHIFRALNPDSTYYICFDQLDLGFSTTDSTYGQRLIGLLVAARDLFVAAKNAGKRFSPVVFLRDDIFQDLQFEDKNKILENFATKIAWTESGSGLTLKSLMERRFEEVLGSDSKPPITWADVFDETQEMPGRQTKYKHLCDRTLLRPRDMIKLCNEVLASHNADNKIGKFDNASVHAARESYSDYLLNEIDDEIAKHVPEYKEYLEVVKAVGAEKFELEQFAEGFSLRASLSATSPTDALADLFAFSIVSYLKPGGRGGGSEYVWRYKDPRARFDATATSFRVHPGFKETLGLLTR